LPDRLGVGLTARTVATERAPEKQAKIIIRRSVQNGRYIEVALIQVALTINGKFVGSDAGGKDCGKKLKGP
jgi:hypothetical protein